LRKKESFTLRTYQIDVNGQVYTVEIEDPNATPVQVTVNGRPFKVTVNPKPLTTAKPAPSRISEAAGTNLTLDTYVPAVAATYIEIAPEKESLDTAQPLPQTPGQGAEAVTAPMPGTILDIAVKVGDSVQPGDIMCNLEAMKMKSPIRSSSSGTLTQVLISEGQNVGFGDTLFIVR
jgi:glutaconyl-CoA/methylmalonyl-CoA decarboxylase subunit gamma